MLKTKKKSRYFDEFESNPRQKQKTSTKKSEKVKYWTDESDYILEKFNYQTSR
jgi:hypothetical protein